MICQHGATLEMSWRARARWRRLNRRTEMPCITAATWPTCCITCEFVFYRISYVIVHVSFTLNAHLPFVSLSIRLCQSVCLWGFCARLSSKCVSTHGCSSDIRLCANKWTSSPLTCVRPLIRAPLSEEVPVVLYSPECCLSDRIINDAVWAWGGKTQKHPQPTLAVCSNVCGFAKI